MDAATINTSGSDANEVKTRLVDLLGDATIDVPNLAFSQPFFRGYWRKLRGPWVHGAGVAAQLVTTIALRAGNQTETQWEVATQTGQTWVPDVRVWNMNEGSFDQREAIYAPTPAALTFRVPIPPGARLRFSPAVAMRLPATTLFGVSVVDASGQQRYVSQTVVAPADDRRWLDAEVDLDPWSGQTVDLVLRTWIEKAPDSDKRATETNDDSTEGSGDAGPPPVPPMALALWGDPLIVAREATRAPYNVLWVVVDALRPDVAASLHDPTDDATKLTAHYPPLDALLPAIPGLMPGIDRLAARGVHFSHAWSVATWTRPGTLAMLTGERSTEVGIDTSNWVEPQERIARYYASNPPLLPRLLRHSGMTTAAFVNNFFMTGYAVVGLDMGFERITDHRYRTRDTGLITQDALSWLDAHAGDRFFLFVNYNSPHEPYDPPKEMLARIPPSPEGPRDGHVRAYMAEAAKDDAAVGVLLDKLDGLRLAGSTLVVVTSDHGETLSAAHDGIALIGGDEMPMRFHHAVGNFEETSRIPIVMALPGVLDGGRAIRDRVRSIDIAPTILALEGLAPSTRMSGRSLLGLARGGSEPMARVVVNEGRLSRAVMCEKWRLIVHDAPPHPQAEPDDSPPLQLEDELYDLEDDPGERHNVARTHPDVVADLRARLAEAIADVQAPETPRAVATATFSSVHLRFVGAGQAHKVSGTVTVGDEHHPATIGVEPTAGASATIRRADARVDFELATSPDAAVGLDLHVRPAGAAIAWRLSLDGGPWPAGATFAGPFGLKALASKGGIATPEARAEARAAAPPVIDPLRDLGVFVTRDGTDQPSEATVESPTENSEGMKEMQRVLQEWGYAHGSH
jgi:choline-sulfatase